MFRRLLIRWFRPVTAVTAATALALALIPPAPAQAAGSKELQRVEGTVGYTQSQNGTFNDVVGSLPLPDNVFAVTRANSSAILRMPDSSEIGLGANTNVQVAAFNDMRNGPGTSITINNGALKFDIRHPAGRKANYKFLTPTSQIAVRGTVGLIATTFTSAGPTSTIACVSGSFTATVGTTTVTVGAGQAISVVGGSVSTTTLSSVVSSFQQAGITQPTGAGAGVGGSTAGGSSASSGTSGGNTTNTGTTNTGTTGGGTTGGTTVAGSGGTGGVGAGGAGAGVTGAGTTAGAGAGAGAGAAAGAGGAAAAGGAVVATTSKGNSATPTPAPTNSPITTTTPTPTVTSTPTPAVTSTPTLTTTPTPSPSASSTPTPVLTATPSPTATPTSSSTSSSSGPLNVTPSVLQLVGLSTSGQFSIANSGISSIFASVQCATPAPTTPTPTPTPSGSPTATPIPTAVPTFNVSVSAPSSLTNPLVYTVTATGVENTSTPDLVSGHACIITFSSPGFTSATVGVDISTTSLNINRDQRRPDPTVRRPANEPLRGPAPIPGPAPPPAGQRRF